MSETPRAEQPEQKNKELTNEEKLLNSILGREDIDPSIFVANEEQIQKEKEEFARSFEKLDERERQIVKLRYGLDEEKVHSFKEIGKIVGLTDGRVYQIEQKALWKLGVRREGKNLSNRENKF